MVSVPQAIRVRVRAMVRTGVEAQLVSRRQCFSDASDDIRGLVGCVSELERRIEREISRLSRTPFHAGMSIHATHARHPGVQALFARRGLPACTDCAVGADETLEEAAFGEGFDLDGLLHDMNALLDVS